MRRLLPVVLLSALTALAGCDDKPSSSSGSGKPPPPVPTPPPATSPAVVNAKLGCIPAKDGGNVIATSGDPGAIFLVGARSKATLATATEHVTLDADGKPEGPMQAGAEPPPASASASPLEATFRAGGKVVTMRPDPAGPKEAFDAPVAAAGATFGALAWRVTKGDDVELRVARAPYDDKVDGGAPAKKEPPTVLVKNAGKSQLGAPALAFEGDVLHVVWPERAGDKTPWRLRWAKWGGKGAPNEPQYLSTRGGSATEPALAIQPSGLFLIAWTDGEPGKTVVKAGASRISFLHALTNADEVSGPPGPAHGAIVTVDGPKTWVAWRDDKGLRSTTLRCIE